MINIFQRINIIAKNSIVCFWKKRNKEWLDVNFLFDSCECRVSTLNWEQDLSSYKCADALQFLFSTRMNGNKFPAEIFNFCFKYHSYSESNYGCVKKKTTITATILPLNLSVNSYWHSVDPFAFYQTDTTRVHSIHFSN